MLELKARQPIGGKSRLSCMMQFLVNIGNLLIEEVGIAFTWRN